MRGRFSILMTLKSNSKAANFLLVADGGKRPYTKAYVTAFKRSFLSRIQLQDLLDTMLGPFHILGILFGRI